MKLFCDRSVGKSVRFCDHVGGRALSSQVEGKFAADDVSKLKVRDYVRSLDVRVRCTWILFMALPPPTPLAWVGVASWRREWRIWPPFQDEIIDSKHVLTHLPIFRCCGESRA